MPCHATKPSSSHRSTAPSPNPPRAADKQPALAARKVLGGGRQQTNILATPTAFCARGLSKNHSVLLERQLRCTALGTQNYISEVALRTWLQLALTPQELSGVRAEPGSKHRSLGGAEKEAASPQKPQQSSQHPDRKESASRTALPNPPWFFPSLYPHGWRYSGAAGGLENKAGVL